MALNLPLRHITIQKLSSRRPGKSIQGKTKDRLNNTVSDWVGISLGIWSKCKNGKWEGYKSTIIVWSMASLENPGWRWINLFRWQQRNMLELDGGSQEGAQELRIQIKKTHKIINLMTNKYSGIIVLYPPTSRWQTVLLFIHSKSLFISLHRPNLLQLIAAC